MDGGVPGDGEVEVGSNFLLVESRHGKQTIWAGRTTHKLRIEDGGFRMALKKVELVNRDDPIGNLAFLI